MSGILNNKKRIMDVVITNEGKRQMANGDIRIRFASFTDKHTYYEADAVSGSSDASNRLYFEASSLPFDQITFETDDSGNMIKFEGAEIEFDGDRIFSGAPGARLKEVTDSNAFSSAVSNLLRSSVNNFKKHRIIGTLEAFNNSQGFELAPKRHTFKITSKSPINVQEEISKVSINSVEPLFLDKRLSHLPNFKFLPPRNAHDHKLLAKFSDINDGHDLTLGRLKRELRNKPYVDIEFKNTSFENNIIAQFFDVRTKSMSKLDTIDFGEFVDRDGEECRVFFLGKIFIDEMGNPTFVNVFTMIYGIDGFDQQKARKQARSSSSSVKVKTAMTNSGKDSDEDDL